MAALPVVCKTNHGIATNARTFPVSETALAPSRARIGMRRFGPVVRESSTAPHRIILWAIGSYHLLETGRRANVGYAVLTDPGQSAKEALEITRLRNALLDQYCAQIDRDSAEITRSLLAWRFVSETPFDSNDAFQDFVGRYREVGIDEFIFYWLLKEAPEYGYDRSMVERLSTEVIPKLRS